MRGFLLTESVEYLNKIRFGFSKKKKSHQCGTSGKPRVCVINWQVVTVMARRGEGLN